jgi:hypothetical protein
MTDGSTGSTKSDQFAIVLLLRVSARDPFGAK